MRIAVCDNDKNFLNSMETLLNKAWQGNDHVITCYSSGAKLWEECGQKKVSFDVIFMDIEMEGMDGITLGKKLKELDEEMLLIFLTNYSEYAVRGYEAKAFRYLLKPVNEQMLKNIMAEIQQERSRKQVLHIPGDGEELLLPLSKVLYLESREKYTTIYVDGQKYLTRNSLNDYEQQLKSKGFCRIHRKYLVNLYRVSRWSSHQLEIDGKELPISRRREKEFREQFYGYLEKGIQE